MSEELLKTIDNSSFLKTPVMFEKVRDHLAVYLTELILKIPLLELEDLL